MAFDFDKLFGRVIPSYQLTLPRAVAITAYAQLSESDYVNLIEARADRNGNETVLLQLAIELPQHLANPINPIENVAVTVASDKDFYPEVLMLRDDFPLVPHLNLQSKGLPKSICLYEESYDEVKLHWTAHHFVERIRMWLAKTADGTLHHDDQPLEPLLASPYGTIVVPEKALLKTNTLGPYFVTSLEPNERGSVWTAFDGDALKLKESPTHVLLAFQCPPQSHGVIRNQPGRISELVDLLEPIGFDLLSEIRSRLDSWKSSQSFKSIGEARVFLLLALPKRRCDEGKIEAIEWVAFLCGANLNELNHQIDNYRATEAHIGIVQIPDSIRKAANIELLPFGVTPQFSPQRGALLNGIPEESRKFCLIGAGALGSQAFDNLVRSGFGTWTVIDDDRLLPHNLARHSLTGGSIGANKAEHLCATANSLMLRQIAEPMVANCLRPADKKARLDQELENADVILDCSASIPVARSLATGELRHKRAISLFLNPAGTSLVMLAEDSRRACRLDWLEMQYYREISRREAMKDHLRSTQKTRYANACRTISSQLQQDSCAIFAGIGSRSFRTMSIKETSAIRIWELGDLAQVQCLEIEVAPVIEQRVGTWKVLTDHVLLELVSHLRMSRLPNETGGVLIGSYDHSRKILYVVDALPSPPDSEEWPTSYKRGCRGLSPKLDTIRERTLGNLQYIGEWHSHPDSISVNQSSQDLVAMAEITRELAKSGQPGVMLITGENESYKFYISSPRQSACT